MSSAIDEASPPGDPQLAHGWADGYAQPRLRFPDAGWDAVLGVMLTLICADGLVAGGTSLEDLPLVRSSPIVAYLLTADPRWSCRPLDPQNTGSG